MNRITIFILFSLGLWACKGQSKKNTTGQTEPNIETENSKYHTINLQFNTPIILDSSNWAIYPLTLEELEETEIGFTSSGYGRQQVYWNVAFYNTETKQTQLLSDSLKMIIHSINTKNEVVKKSEQHNNVSQKLIYYSISTNDFNQDKILDFNDPKYLFISDLSGQNFRQVSPDNFDIYHWETMNSTNKILIQAYRDSNNDKIFASDDEVVSFIYDIATETLEQVFSDEFSLMTKKLLGKKWLQKTKF